MIKPTFSALSDFPHTYRVECGRGLSHTIHYKKLLDRVISIGVMDDGGFTVSLNNPCFQPGSDEPGRDWDSTLTNDSFCETLEDALTSATCFASTETPSWDRDLWLGTVSIIKNQLAS